MKFYHVIFHKYLTSLIPIVIEHYSVAGILSIGTIEENVPYINIIKINLDINNFSNPISLASAIIYEIKKIKTIKDEKIQIAVVGESSLEVLSLYLVAQSLNSSAYTIHDQKIVQLPPLSISKVSSDELVILDYLHEFESIDSMGELAEKLNWGKKENPNMVAKIAYSVRKLSSKRLIDTFKEGRSVRLKITDAGRQYIQLFGTPDLNKEKIEN